MNWIKFFKLQDDHAPSVPAQSQAQPEEKLLGRLVPIEYIDGCFSVEVYDELLKDFIKIDSTNSERHGRFLIKEYHRHQEIKKRGPILVY